MISNKGITTTSINNNCQHSMNEISWKADYDGKNANVDIDINDNGRTSHIDMILNNEDLAKIFNIPTVNLSLEKRLKKDFKTKKLRPAFIELADNNSYQPPNTISVQPYINKQSYILESPPFTNPPKKKNTKRLYKRTKSYRIKTPVTQRIHFTN